MVNHYWDGEVPEWTACFGYGGPLVEDISINGEWRGVSCPDCLDKRPTTTLADERADVLDRFADELAKATGDGSRKRQAGTKPPWYQDDAHEAAMYRHLERWEAGEKHDPDHEAHPLVAAAWRALAIACKESGNVPNG